MSNRALLVGIDKYPPNEPQLSGCVNDVTGMAQFLLSQCKFPPQAVVCLLDGDAKTSDIRGALTELVEQAQPGDRLLFYYSGHGTQLPLTSASGTPTLHDVICPVDFDHTPDHALSDEDFKQIFQKLPAGVEFNWASDSCNSGNLGGPVQPAASRRAYNADDPAGPVEGASRRPRCLPPPSHLQSELEKARSLTTEPCGFHGAMEGLNGAFISASASNQLSVETVFGDQPDQPLGALTHALLHVLRAPDGRTIPFKEVRDRVVCELKKGGFDQEPQLSGNPAIIGKPFV
jgi:hypothetical protein